MLSTLPPLELAPVTAAQADEPISIALEVGAARTELRVFDAPDARHSLLIVPALGVGAHSYLKLGRALADRGVSAAVADLRGVGRSSVRARRGVDWGYLDLVDGELRALHTFAARRWPQARPVWMGHSLGGHLALLHQARHGDQPVAEIALVASGSPWYRNYPGMHRWAVRSFGGVARGSSRMLGVFRGDWVGFGGAQGARLMREWGDFCTRGRLPPLGHERWDPYPALAQVTRPKYALSMRADTYAPTASTEHLASLIGGPLTLQHVDRVADDKAPGHFLWMRHPEPVAELLAARYR